MTSVRQRIQRNKTVPMKLILTCIILHVTSAASTMAYANLLPPVAGIIDGLEASQAKLSPKELTKDIKKEQKSLAKQSRNQLQKKAEQGERLAQVALGSDFASEAQMLTFAPKAANDALSDALQWYALAAKRGFPGAPSLDRSGVSFYPIRVVRNR